MLLISALMEVFAVAVIISTYVDVCAVVAIISVFVDDGHCGCVITRRFIAR